MTKILFKNILQERVCRVIMRVRDSICAQNYTLTHFKNEQYPRDFEILQSEDYTEQKFFGNLKRKNDVDSTIKSHWAFTGYSTQFEDDLRADLNKASKRSERRS